MKGIDTLLVAVFASLIQLPESGAEHEALARAVAAEFPDAPEWKIRRVDEAGFRAGPEDWAVFVDLAPVPYLGRVQRHVSARCSRTQGATDWECRDRRTLLAVTPPDDFDPSSHVCPGFETAIEVSEEIPPELIPEYTDYVRFSSEGRERLLGCWRNGTNQLLEPRACDVDSIARAADGAITIGIRIRVYSWLYVDVLRECSSEGCSIKFLKCRGYDY